MNSFDKARLVEERAMAMIVPWLELQSYRGRLVVTEKGLLSEFIQATCGDLLFNTDPKTVRCIEIKAEQSEYTHNLFLETWSNRVVGGKLGWMFTLKCDLIGFFFLDTRQLYVFQFPQLWRWCFELGRIYSYPEKPQRKYAQLNKTHGRCVPIDDLRRDLNSRVIQLPEERGGD